MADNFLAGPAGSVSTVAPSFTIGGPYSFDKWKLSMKTTVVEVTSFTSAGFQVLVSAITSATVNLSGPYNQGNMPFTVGEGYTFKLSFSASIYLLVYALIESLEPDVDVKGRSSISITAQSSTGFSFSIS